LSWWGTTPGLAGENDTANLVPWKFVPVSGTTDQFYIYTEWGCAWGDGHCGMNLSFTGTTAEIVAASDTYNLVPWKVTTVDSAEVLDQQPPAFNGAAEPWGTSKMAQVFTPGETGYLTHFGIWAAPCYDYWGYSCFFTLELRAVDASGNPAA